MPYHDRLIADLVIVWLTGRTFFALATQIIEFFVRQMLDADVNVFCRTCADQLVELDLDGRAITVLRILNQKDHQEGDDGRARVDHELPGVGIVEQRAGKRPYKYDADRHCECWRLAAGDRYGVRKLAKYPADSLHGPLA